MLDPWQENVLQGSMGERADGQWSTPRVGLSCPRQNGKGEIIVARELAGLLLFGEQVIVHSAHQQSTARVGFDRILSYFENFDDLRRRVKSVMRALNREYIELKTGQVLRFPARSKGTLRGFSADCLILDEAQILGDAAWQAIQPTISARPNPQTWLLGTPPTPLDDGAVFGRMRAGGLEGKDHRLAWFEWSADATSDLDDPAAWAQANPALGIRITPTAIRDERETMDDAGFGRERLGMWDDPESAQQVIDRTTWDLRADPLSVPVDQFALAVGVSPDRSSASVALAGVRGDGLWHVELDEQRNGVAWVAPYVQGRVQANRIRAVVVNGSSPAVSVIEDLTALRIKVTTTDAKQVAAAFAGFFDAVMDGSVRHTGQGQVTAALAVARKRELAGGSAWSQKNSASDITPIEACTFALYGAQSTRVKRPGHGAAAGGGRSNGDRVGTVM